MTTFLINGETMGSGKNELGRLLMEKFFTTLADAETLPEKIIFYNTGVLLCRSDSPVAAYLTALKKRGVTLSACGTCLNHLGVEETLPAVDPGTMRDFVSHVCQEQGTITI